MNRVVLFVAFILVCMFLCVRAQVAQNMISTEVEKSIEEHKDLFTAEDVNSLRTMGASLDFLLKRDEYNRFAAREEKAGDMCIHIYGKFCGPGFCDNKWWDGCKNSKDNMTKCNFNGSYVDEVDRCCRIHDKCCVDSRKTNKCSHCEENMVKCLKNAKIDSFLKNPKQNVAQKAMELFFKHRPGCC